MTLIMKVHKHSALTVDVGSTSGIVARNDGIKLENTIFIGRLNATKHGAVDVIIVRVSKGSTRAHTSIDTLQSVSLRYFFRRFRHGNTYGRVAMPQIKVDVRDGLAGVDIKDLNIKSQSDTRLILSYILADQLASNI
jgi:hypothetical protein